jgi:hypothetical protein
MYDLSTGNYQGSAATLLKTGETIRGEWIELTGREFTLKIMTMTSPTTDDNTQHFGLMAASPTNFTLLGRNDATDRYELIEEFVGLDAVPGDTFDGKPHLIRFDNNETRYRSHRLVINKTNRNSGFFSNENRYSFATVGIWRLYGPAHEALSIHGDNQLFDRTTTLYNMMK